eukprot:SAG31_NODE_2247_length_6094_cov_6.426522_2_plen_371_part_00
MATALLAFESGSEGFGAGERKLRKDYGDTCSESYSFSNLNSPLVVPGYSNAEIMDAFRSLDTFVSHPTLEDDKCTTWLGNRQCCTLPAIDRSIDSFGGVSYDGSSAVTEVGDDLGGGPGPDVSHLNLNLKSPTVCKDCCGDVVFLDSDFELVEAGWFPQGFEPAATHRVEDGPMLNGFGEEHVQARTSTAQNQGLCNGMPAAGRQSRPRPKSPRFSRRRESNSCKPSGVPGPNGTAVVEDELVASSTSKAADSSDASTGRKRKNYPIPRRRQQWSDSDHRRFVAGVQLFGRDWKRVTDHLANAPDRPPNSFKWCQRDVRSHAQKYFARVKRDQLDFAVPTKKRVRRATAACDERKTKDETSDATRDYVEI